MRITSQKGFSGVDERVSLQNSPRYASAMRNFRITESGSLQKRPDAVYCCDLPDETIRGVWRGSLNGTDTLLLVGGTSLYRADPNLETISPVYVGYVGMGECNIFEFNGFVYIKTVTNYVKYNGTVFSNVDGYVPIVAIGCSPEGEGELYEPINLICNKRRIRYSADGVSKIYKIIEDGVIGIKHFMLNGEAYDADYTFDAEKKTVTFSEPPPAGLNNLEICYIMADSVSQKWRFLGCRNLMLFGGNSDGRIFLWGHNGLPNYRFHSELAEGVPSAEYFPVNNYTVIGNSEITCIVQQYDRQLIFTKDKAYYSYCELREDMLGNLYSSFPVFSLNGSKGCLFRTNGCVIDNRPVTLCVDGINLWESTDIENEKNAVCISREFSGAFRNLINDDLSKMKLMDFQANRELYLINGSIAYVYNYGLGAWYLFNGFADDCCFVYGTKMYFANGSKLYWFGNEAGSGEDRTDIWESCFITAGADKGAVDAVGCELDAFIQGPVTVCVELEESGSGRKVSRSFDFPFTENRFRRLSFRPALKRVMPFRIRLTESGKGSCVFHNISIITRSKERSSRRGIL